MKKTGKTVLIVVLIDIAVVMLLFILSFVLKTYKIFKYPVEEGYKYLYGYGVYYVSGDLETENWATNQGGLRFYGTQDDDFIFNDDGGWGFPWEGKYGIYIKEKSKEPVLSDEYTVKEIKFEFPVHISNDDLVINDESTIERLLDLRRNGETVGVVENGSIGDERLCGIRFVYNMPYNFFWETDVEITNDGKIFLVFDEGMTGDRYAVDATEVLKDILGDFLPKEQ